MNSQTLVPPGRLGSLLIEHRNRHGLSVADLAIKSGVFSASELDQAERGAATLNDEQVDALMTLYGVDLATGTYGRSELIVDLKTNTIGVGATSLRFEGPTQDLVLERYVSLLYLLREQPVGVSLPLRDNDLDTLGSTLDRRRNQLVTDIHAIMSDRRTVGRTRRISRQRRVLQAGLLVGATMAGALIMVGDVIGSTADAMELPAQRGELVSASLPLDLATVLPNWTIEFQEDHPIYGGITHSSNQVITVHVDPTWSDHQLASVLMHEAGHAIDLEYLDDATRTQWLQLRGMNAPWWVGDGLADFAVGAGDFAEAVAAVTLGQSGHNTHDGHGHTNRSHHGEFTAEQLDFVKTILSNATRTLGARSL